MKKLLYTATLVLVLVALAGAAPLQAADCAVEVPLSTVPTVSADGSAAATPAPVASIGRDAWVDPALLASDEIFTSIGDWEICNWQACIQTPTGCGCSGFYCNGQFICGYRIKW